MRSDHGGQHVQLHSVQFSKRGDVKELRSQDLGSTDRAVQNGLLDHSGQLQPVVGRGQTALPMHARRNQGVHLGSCAFDRHGQHQRSRVVGGLHQAGHESGCVLPNARRFGLEP